MRLATDRSTLGVLVFKYGWSIPVELPAPGGEHDPGSGTLEVAAAVGQATHIPEVQVDGFGSPMRSAKVEELAGNGSVGLPVGRWSHHVI